MSRDALTCFEEEAYQVYITCHHFCNISPYHHMCVYVPLIRVYRIYIIHSSLPHHFVNENWIGLFVASLPRFSLKWVKAIFTFARLIGMYLHRMIRFPFSTNNTYFHQLAYQLGHNENAIKHVSRELLVQGYYILDR